jgi:nucleotide-binding universal stress UspA family protein
MIKFSHVLYPTDLSHASRPALRHAAAVARWYEASLTVLHVVPTFEPIAVPSETTGAPGSQVEPPSQAEVEAAVRRSLPADTIEGLDVRVVAAAGDPVKVIVEHARSSSADLVVMGTHGRSGFRRLVSGSVTESVLGAAPCPVLTVPPHADGDATPHATFRRLLCATDFSPASKRALTVGLDLARQSNGRVTVLHTWHVEDEPRVHAYVGDIRHQLEERARAALHDLVAAEPQTWCDIDEIVAMGSASHEILRVAAEQASDLIAMGAQSHHGLGLTLVGSTTQHVVRAAECPVLVVRGPQ